MVFVRVDNWAGQAVNVFRSGRHIIFRLANGPACPRHRGRTFNVSYREGLTAPLVELGSCELKSKKMSKGRDGRNKDYTFILTNEAIATINTALRSFRGFTNTRTWDVGGIYDPQYL